MKDLIFLHVSVLLIVGAIFYILFKRGSQEKAIFGLYKVRDDFILLIAKDVLKEDDPIFSFYYKRINNLLLRTPRVGVDDIAEIAFSVKFKNDFDKAFLSAQKKLIEIHSNKILNNQEVRMAVISYYSSVEYLMLTHSSFLRLFVLMTKFITEKTLNDIIFRLGSKRFKFIVRNKNFIDDAEISLMKPAF